MQFSYYASLTVCMGGVAWFAGLRPHLGMLFSPTSLNFSLDYSYAAATAHLLNIPFVVLANALIVEKANKCLDHTMTVFFWHFIFTVYNYKFPTHGMFYVVHAALITITVVASEFTCMRLETAEIKLSVSNIFEKGKKIGQELTKNKTHKDKDLNA